MEIQSAFRCAWPMEGAESRRKIKNGSSKSFAVWARSYAGKRKIGDDPHEPRWIKTVHSVGYRMEVADSAFRVDGA